MRQVVLDTETTGINPDHGHRVLEIAAIEIIDRKVTDNYLHLYCNPGRESDPKALEVHGLTSSFLSQYPPFEQTYQQFLDFVLGAVLIIHNAPFDIGFLDAELMRIPECKKLHHYCPEIIDTLLMGRRLFPGKRNSLDALCERYQVDTSERVKHGALIDVRLLAQVYLCMTRGQQGFDLSSSPRSSSAVGVGHPVKEPQCVDLPVIMASEADKEAHEAYLTALEAERAMSSVWRS